MKKIVPLALLIPGFLIMSGSFVYYAANALPYPDPTAELLARQSAEAKKLSLIFVPGLISFIVGGAWLWRGSRPKKHT
jgi:hypothetical protein